MGMEVLSRRGRLSSACVIYCTCVSRIVPVLWAPFFVPACVCVCVRESSMCRGDFGKDSPPCLLCRCTPLKTEC